MTPSRMARCYYRYFNERRFDDAGELVHPEAIFHYVPTRQHLVGRAGYRALVAAWMIAFEDATVEIVSLESIDDHTVQIDFIGHGTHTGDLVLGEDFTIPATGTRSELPFRDTLTFRSGLIVQSRLEFDAQKLRQRLMRSSCPHCQHLDSVQIEQTLIGPHSATTFRCVACGKIIAADLSA
jgi:ribosomal protein S27E